MLHHLKIKEEFADAIVRGEKTFEIRINDRGFQKGDLIEFTTVQEDLPFPDCHPIHNRTYEITYVMNGWGLKNEYVVFGIREEDTSIKCQFAEHDADGCLEDRAVSLNAVKNAIRHAEVNFSVKSEIDFTKHKREVHEIIDNILDAQEKALKELPPIISSRPIGHWITEAKSDLRDDMWPINPKCSICGKEPFYSNTIYNYSFCPYCGADMRGDENGR